MRLRRFGRAPEWAHQCAIHITYLVSKNPPAPTRSRRHIGGSPRRFHPDQNKDDPKAKEKFAEANSSYEIVGDEKKRAQFDRGEIDAEGKPRFQGFEGFGAGAGARRPGAGNPSGAEYFEFGAGAARSDAAGHAPADSMPATFLPISSARRARAGRTPAPGRPGRRYHRQA